MHFPEPVEIRRTIDHARGFVTSVRGGFVYRVLVRLNNGGLIRYFEAERNGRLTVCDTRAEAYEVLRHA